MSPPEHTHRPVDAHDQALTHRYTVRFPEHAPREGDPHYAAFSAYRRHFLPGALCYVGQRAGASQCTDDRPLELHHATLEFAVVNAVSAEALHRDFPEISEHATAEEIAAWAESSPGQFRWLCQFHHRGHGGAHTASHADWTAQLYVPELIE
ncbi:hypothetical protein [Streptacidiphilus albus]|uniref:hypothetical protein n=1 Tax=Streptacidiphilus albus TaxID=105425 RepID=UPI00054B74ED|nr:hypothetical protein [Streptacidiphilus albus]